MSYISLKRLKKISLLLCFWSVVFSMYAQDAFTLKMESNTSDKVALELIDKTPKKYTDTVSIFQGLETLLSNLHSQAYLSASIDSLSWRDSTIIAQLFLGERFEWVALKNGNVKSEFLDELGFREQLYSGKPFSYLQLQKLQNDLLTYAENNGFPFSVVWLDNIKIEAGKVSAEIFMQRHREIRFEGIKIFGKPKLSKQYFENYLGIHKGELYNNAKILRIKDRLRELPFIRVAKDATVSFQGNKAVVNLFVEHKNASKFDFLVGVQPRTSTASNNTSVRTFQLTGTFNADLNNQFGHGEKIFLEFRQLRPQTPELQIALNYPYFLDLPYGADLKFNLYKRDSAYLDVITDIGVQYLMDGGDYLRAFWNNASTSVLTIDENRILESKQLPTSLDLTRNSFGLAYQKQNLNYRYNPRKGLSLYAEASAGIKRIRKNAKILDLATEEFDTETLYDTLKVKSFQYRFGGNVAYYFPLGKRTVLKTAIRGGYILGNNDVYRNEQFRIGGNKILRGFDEESIFATNYGILTTEIRLLLGQNSYLFAFGDFGYVENITNIQRRFDRPIGLGAGITFETKVGLFGFSLAVGQEQGNGFDFRSVKTHFGYISLF